MVDNKDINIMKIGSLKSSQLKTIAKTLQLKNISDKSGEMLRQEIQHLAKTFIAGQVRFSCGSKKFPFMEQSQG